MKNDPFNTNNINEIQKNGSSRNEPFLFIKINKLQRKNRMAHEGVK